MKLKHLLFLWFTALRGFQTLGYISVAHLAEQLVACPEVKVRWGKEVDKESIVLTRVRLMYTSDIKNRRHRSLLEHRRQQVADVDVVKK